MWVSVLGCWDLAIGFGPQVPLYGFNGCAGCTKSDEACVDVFFHLSIQGTRVL